MACQKCSSESQNTFNGELAIHFAGLKGLDKAIVWVYPKLTVCLTCGFAEFTVPERELGLLLHDTSVVNAIVSIERGTPENRERSILRIVEAAADAA
jgi:hypothetical protein